jgi:hypothetical protein
LQSFPVSSEEGTGSDPAIKEITMKKAYTKPALRRLGLLRQITRFSF